jgi:hypothetical protein
MIHSSVRRRRRAQKTDPSAPIFSFKKEEKKPQLFLYKASHPFNKKTYIKPNLSLISSHSPFVFTVKEPKTKDK